MMTLEKLIADRLASPDHCEYLGSNTSRFIEESEKKYREIFDKDIVTKAEKGEMDNRHWECIANTEAEQYLRGFFDALALVPGHGLTEEGLRAAIERASNESDARLFGMVNVILKEVGTERIKVIVAVREVTGLGLKEAHDIVEGVPSVIKEGIPRDEAFAIAAKFKGVGAAVTYKPV